CGLDFYLGSPKEIAVIGNLDSPDARALLRTVFDRFLPNRVVAAASPEAVPSDIPVLADRGMRDGRATAYVCQNYTCRTPVTTPEEIAVQLATPLELRTGE
nr:thioredoxin domain-containing protein [Chloroflexota bacterium]